LEYVKIVDENDILKSFLNDYRNKQAKSEKSEYIMDSLINVSTEDDLRNALRLNFIKQLLSDRSIKKTKRSRKQLFTSGLQGVWGVPGK
jgi:hypothetical protein